MAAAAWWRAWRLRLSGSSTTHGLGHGGGGNKGYDADGCSLRPAASSGDDTTPYSTSTTTGSGGSRSATTISGSSGSFIILPPTPTLEPVMEEANEEETINKKLKHMEALVVRFPSDESSPERWLLELDVFWVLRLAHERSFIGGQLLYLARSWILALFEITKAISTYFDRGLFILSKEESGPPASEFQRFFQATLSKMLPFVDASIVEVRGSTHYGGRSGWDTLQAAIRLRDALSTASTQILSSSFAQETIDLLTAKLMMLDQAIWDAIKETKARLTMSSFSSWEVATSSDIHPITHSLISCIKVLCDNYVTTNLILHDAFLRGEESVPDNGNTSHLTNLTKEMIHSLEQMLTRFSCYSNATHWSKGRELIFLINNFHFIHQQKKLWPLAFPMPHPADLAPEVDDYINTYVQVSWAPVLKCLHNPTPGCFRGDSQLPKFEAYFQSTYNAHKRLKVPDPGVRTRMREAIIQELIPGFTEFFKDNSPISTSRISPQEMKTMLQELFEG